jgi:putative ABC transport system permease protein
MFRNYIITALRNLFKNRVFSLINILGLSVGLASFVLISLYVYHELSMDRYHEKADRIYRIVENLRTENELLFQSVSSPPMAPILAKDFAEVESYVRFTEGRYHVRKGDLSFYENEVVIVDSTLFDVFSFKLLKGDPKTALTKPQTVVLTESSARKYFGDSDPLGQTLEMDGETYQVTGVMKDVPENSHFRFDMAISFSTWSSKNKENEMSEWFWNGFHTYILLREGTSIELFQAKIPGFIEKNIEKGGMYYEALPLQPLTSIYLETPRSWENGKRGSASNIYVLSAIALFTLLIACFNYVNLSTARATRRLKEVGLRKVLGAQRRMLIIQFLSESIIVSLAASFLAFVAAWLALPAFNTLVESQISFGILPHTYYVWGSLILLGLFLGLLSGAYPAMMISGFEPLQMFRPSIRGIFTHRAFRRMLVSLQFVISICLVSGTLLVYSQLDLVRHADLGFTKDATAVLYYNGDVSVRDHLEAVKNELKSVGGVISLTASHSVPGQSVTNLFTMIEMKDGKMSPTNINTNFVDHDFFPAYGVALVSGRNFSRDLPADDTTAFILNETAVKDFGWTHEEALGKKINQQGKHGTVIGVAKDFHYQSLHERIQPMLFALNKYAMSKLSIHINNDNIPAVMSKLEEKWKRLTPGLPFEYSFLDQDYDKLYAADAKLGKVTGVFSMLAIFVGCLGLLGLTSFSVERRVKEIGIRKVLGASSAHVVFIISSEFIKLIGIAFLLAVPATYYMIGQWLNNFTDHIAIGPSSFLIAGAAVLALTWLTVSYLSFKAAATNPSEALRNE